MKELFDFLDRNLAPQSEPEKEDADALCGNRFPHPECNGDDEGLGAEILEKPEMNGQRRFAAEHAD